MNDISPLLEKMIELWRSANVVIPSGAEEAAIAKFELRHGVQLPEDMRKYFLTVNGMGNREEMDNDMFGFWPIEEVKPVKEYAPEVIAEYPQSAGYFCFFDHSIDLFLFAIRLNCDGHFPTPIAEIFFGQTPQKGCSFLPRFESFTEMIGEYVVNPANLF